MSGASRLHRDKLARFTSPELEKEFGRLVAPGRLPAGNRNKAYVELEPLRTIVRDRVRVDNPCAEFFRYRKTSTPTPKSSVIASLESTPYLYTWTEHRSAVRRCFLTSVCETSAPNGNFSELAVGPTNVASLRNSTIRIATGHCATTVLARYLIAVPIARQATKPLVSTAKPRVNHEVGYCNAAHFAETGQAADDVDDFSTCELEPL